VLRRIPGLRPPLFGHSAGEADARFDVVRSYLRCYGPARFRDAAVFLDARVKDVKAHWPEDAVELEVSDSPNAGAALCVADHLDAPPPGGSGAPGRSVRLLGPYDSYL